MPACHHRQLFALLKKFVGNMRRSTCSVGHHGTIRIKGISVGSDLVYLALATCTAWHWHTSEDLLLLPELVSRFWCES